MLTRTLTVIDPLNHGAFLQGYALQRFLLDHGVRNEVIDYRPNRWRAELRSALSVPIADRSLDLAPYFRKARVMNAHYRRLERTRLFTRGTEDLAGGADVLIVGSDEVWKHGPDADVDATTLAYFGHRSSAKRKVAYAVSVGGSDVRGALPTSVVEAIREYSHVFVRDGATQDLVERATGVRPPRVVDPVLLVDFETELDAVVPGAETPTPYVLLYAARPDARLSRASVALARALNARLVSAGYANGGCENRVDVDPFTLLQLFRGAALVLTNTFHGSVLAAKFGRPLLVSPHRAKGQKVRSFLEGLDLERCLLDPNGSDPRPDALPDTGTAAGTIEADARRSQRLLLEALGIALR